MLKKPTKPSAAASSLGCRDNCMSNCFYNLSLKISIFILLELNGFSPFSHMFTSVGNESRGCSRLSAAASARVTGCTCSCKACCWETHGQSPPCCLPLALSTLISASASADRHLLLFFQTVLCRGDKTQRQLLQLSCLLRPPKT